MSLCILFTSSTFACIWFNISIISSTSLKKLSIKKVCSLTQLAVAASCNAISLSVLWIYKSCEINKNETNVSHAVSLNRFRANYQIIVLSHAPSFFTHARTQRNATLIIWMDEMLPSTTDTFHATWAAEQWLVCQFTSYRCCFSFACFRSTVCLDSCGYVTNLWATTLIATNWVYESCFSGAFPKSL